MITKVGFSIANGIAKLYMLAGKGAYRFMLKPAGKGIGLLAKAFVKYPVRTTMGVTVPLVVCNSAIEGGKRTAQAAHPYSITPANKLE